MGHNLVVSLLSRNKYWILALRNYAKADIKVFCSCLILLGFFIFFQKLCWELPVKCNKQTFSVNCVHYILKFYEILVQVSFATSKAELGTVIWLIYELPHELQHNLRRRVLGNQETLRILKFVWTTSPAPGLSPRCNYPAPAPKNYTKEDLKITALASLYLKF